MDCWRAGDRAGDDLGAVWAMVSGETVIERRAREARQARARDELAAEGLTPEQYIARIPVTDIRRRAEAAERFGVDFAPKRRMGVRRMRLVTPPRKED